MRHSDVAPRSTKRRRDRSFILSSCGLARETRSRLRTAYRSALTRFRYRESVGICPRSDLPTDGLCLRHLPRLNPSGIRRISTDHGGGPVPELNRLSRVRGRIERTMTQPHDRVKRSPPCSCSHLTFGLTRARTPPTGSPPSRPPLVQLSQEEQLSGQRPPDRLSLNKRTVSAQGATVWVRQFVGGVLNR